MDAVARFALTDNAYQGFRLASGNCSNWEYQKVRLAHTAKVAGVLLTGGLVLATPRLAAAVDWNYLIDGYSFTTLSGIAAFVITLNPITAVTAAVVGGAAAVTGLSSKVMYGVAVLGTPFLLWKAASVAVNFDIHKRVWRQLKQDIHFAWDPAAAGKAQYQREISDQIKRLFDNFKKLFVPVTVGIIALKVLTS